MQTSQLSFFDTLDQLRNENIENENKSIIQFTSVQDVRSEKQKGKSVSFDVGEKIGGARKDIVMQKKAFLEKPSMVLLNDLEEMDMRVAAEVLNRQTFFSWFSLEDCRERRVEPGVAKAIQLFINRIPKESADSPEARRKYTKTLIMLSDLLRTVHTEAEYYQFEKYIISFLVVDREVRKIKDMDNLNIMQKATLSLVELADGMAFTTFLSSGTTFRNYFSKHQSRRSALVKAFSIKSWDELLKPTELNKRKGAARKPVWERILPNSPLRDAGTSISIQNPKDFTEHFGFRATEFGLYVEDDKGKQHLRNAGEALTDLTEILLIPTKAVSLDGTLAMAFGSRGRGRALGHYESLKQVINLTKEKGSLGVLGHEWFHALDHYLFNASHKFENGKLGFLSSGTEGAGVYGAQIAMEELLKVIKEGISTAYIDVRDCKNTYTVYESFTSLYASVNGDLHLFMDKKLAEFDAKVERHLESCVAWHYREKMEEKYAKERIKTIRNNAEALAGYHFKMTGIKVEQIPYTTDRSAYYQYSIFLDKHKIGKYWSSNVELVARAFESYLYEELKDRRWVSDYLVCGIRDEVFPQGEERLHIHAAMAKFIDAVRPILSK